MSSPLDSLVNLPGVTVEGHSQVEGYICIHLKILASEIACPHCRKPIQELHQVRPILVRDLPTFGQPVYLRVPRQQFYCRYCQKYVTQQLDFLSWRRRYTQRYECYIYQRVLMSNMVQVSREEDLSADEVDRVVGVTVKGSKYLLLKNYQDLSETDQEQLEQILSQSACLRLAYEMKEEFRDIYETSKTVQSGLKRMQKWLVQAQVFYGKTAQTIREHLSGICNYFISGTTSGVMEGINNKIKLIMRLGYGLTNFNNLRSRLLGCCC